MLLVKAISSTLPSQKYCTTLKEGKWRKNYRKLLLCELIVFLSGEWEKSEVKQPPIKTSIFLEHFF